MIKGEPMSALVKKMPLRVLNHHPKNPRIHDERNIQAIMVSIKEFKQLAPLVIWGRQNYVIAGNGRLEAMKRLGWKEAEILRADHLTEDQALAYMLADNKTTDLSSFDFQLVADIMGGLHKKGVDLATTAFADFETEPLLQSEWRPPSEADMPTDGDKRLTITFSEEQSAWVRARIDELKEKGESDDDVLVRVLESE
jgi:hypothetical protein